tara:strand:- start:1679 stop:2068 length:390 start_codon:yes stop_codon:yes gene_type:complete
MTKIIMSTDRPNKSQLELHRARKEFEYYLDLKGFKYEVCEGSWEGEREQSYMITLRDAGMGFTSLKRLAFNHYNQDAVLRITAYGGANLHNNDGTRTNLGGFKQVDLVPTDKCYTQSFQTGNIYISSFR